MVGVYHPQDPVVASCRRVTPGGQRAACGDSPPALPGSIGDRAAAPGYPIHMDHDVTVVGQIARDLVLLVDDAPAPGTSASVRQRIETLGGKGANQAVSLAQLGGSVRVAEEATQAEGYRTADRTPPVGGQTRPAD